MTIYKNSSLCSCLTVDVLVACYMLCARKRDEFRRRTKAAQIETATASGLISTFIADADLAKM